MNTTKFIGVFILSVLTSVLHAQTCLPDGISFTTQEQVDAFRVNYPGCEIIEGGVYINDTNISNLDSLIDIVAINGPFYLNDNNAIDLQGLQNVTSLGGLIIKDDGLNNFAGLENVEIIFGDMEIDDCHGISTKGLSSLKEVQGHFYINENSGLSLSDLPVLEKIGGDLIIDDNEVPDLEGLATVTEIGGQLIIQNNTKLSSLVGLDSIDAYSITYLILDASDSLSFCSVKSICDYLSLDLGPSSIGQNLTGCNTAEEILAICSQTTPALNIGFSSIQASPNPVEDLLWIQNSIPGIEYMLFSIDGQTVLTDILQADNRIDLSGLEPGVYLLRIEGFQNVLKVVKMDF